MVKKTKSILEKNSRAALPEEYTQTLVELKRQIQEAQIKAISSVNRELLKLYWSVGKIIVDRQKRSGWGSSVIEQLAKDLQNEFPSVKGFSRTNIFRMRAFYLAYEKVPAPPGQFEELPVFSIPWWHNVVLLERVKNNEQRMWYAQKAIECGWSANMLDTWIKSDLYSRQGKAITNFKRTLPAPHSDMVQQSFKDPYLFDFLTLADDHIEQDLEKGLIDHTEKLLLEMGKGFALVGRQYHLEVDEKDYYIDLLFYHVKLKCYVVVELKAREFDPRDAGQINFYLSAVDDLLRDSETSQRLGYFFVKLRKILQQSMLYVILRHQ